MIDKFFNKITQYNYFGKSKLKFFHYLVGLTLLFSFYDAQAQFNLENWKVHSSMTDLHTIDYDSKGRIWAGGYGGALMYDINTKQISEYRNINALLSLEISKIKCYREKKLIFIGSYDGVVSIVSEDNKWQHFTEIRSFGFPKSAINDFAFQNDVVYIAGDFGIAVFDINQKIFIAQALRLGSFQQNTPVKKLFFDNDRLWVATAEGIAWTYLNSKHSYPPDSWKTYNKSSGLLNNEILGLAKFRDTLFAYDLEHLYKFQEDSFVVAATYNQNGEWICGLEENNDTLYFATRFGLKIYPDIPVLFDAPSLINGFVVGKNGELITMFTDRGFGSVKNSKLLEHIIPNTPSSNLFLNLNVSDNGNLWVSTGFEPGMGAMVLKNGDWTNINQYNFKDLPTNNIICANAIPGKGIYLGTWGAGLLVANDSGGTYSFVQYTNTNSPLDGVTEDPDWVITTESEEDANGNVWTLNYGGASPGTFFLIRKPDNSMIGMEKYPKSNSRWCKELAIDNWNTKWAGSASNDGLYFFNDNGTIDNKSDDIYGTLTSGNSGLINNTQNSLEVDRQGRLWAGTPDGLCVLLNPSAVLSGNTPVVREIRSIGVQPVNDVMIDALNYIWVATTTGVWIIDPDEDIVIASLNTSNSPLITNDVKSLATNKQTGTIYIGTRSALYEVSSMSAMALASYNISCYPQPFYPEKDEQLVIEGLAEFSDIKILTIDGEFVKTIKSRGRKATWDGRNDRGDLVNTGVYIISATSQTRSASGAGKIAVIRK